MTTTPIRLKEIQVTKEHLLGVPVWTTASIHTVAEDQEELAIPALGSTDYWVRYRVQDVYGQYSDWSDVAGITTTVGADSLSLNNSVSSVVVDSQGLHVYNGSIEITDGYGSVVLTAAGFGRPWSAYLYYGFYNANFEQGDLTDIAATEVGGGDTDLEYLQSTGDTLPYWVVRNSGATLSRVATASAVGGSVLRSNSTSGSSVIDIIYQDIPVFPGKRRMVIVRYKATVTSGDVSLRAIYSYRDATHGLLTARAGITTATSTSLVSTGGAYFEEKFIVPVVAPDQAAYVRIEIEVNHISGSNIVDLDSVYAPEDVDLDLLTLDVGTITSGSSGILLIDDDVSVNGDLEVGGRLFATESYMGGVTFPVGPTNGALYFRTDHDMWFQYDGTRWLCTCAHDIPFVMTTTTTLPITATAGNRWHAVFPRLGGMSYFMEGVNCAFLVVSGATALGASHRWNANVRSVPDDVIRQQLAIDSGANDTWRIVSDTGTDSVTDAAVAMSMSWAKTGTPGNLTHQATVRFRYIGT